MRSKQCSRCGVKKLLVEFYQRRTGNRIGEYYEKCKECMKVRGRAYYFANHERQLRLALIRRHNAHKLRRDFINTLKSKPCADCGISYPYYVMDFDHQDQRLKVKDIAYMAARNWSLEKIKQEVEKCDIVCANCHRFRTFKNLAEVAKVVTAGA